MPKRGRGGGGRGGGRGAGRGRTGGKSKWQTKTEWGEQPHDSGEVRQWKPSASDSEDGSGSEGSSDESDDEGQELQVKLAMVRTSPGRLHEFRFFHSKYFCAM